jgi:hypothetical protein
MLVALYSAFELILAVADELGRLLVGDDEGYRPEDNW